MEGTKDNGTPDPFNPVQIMLFGFLPMIGAILVGLFYIIGEVYKFLNRILNITNMVTSALSFHKKLKDLGKTHKKQADDPDYQAEKYLLGKK